ncbi:MAG: hypothetical protein ACR2OZ_19150 [Verrucomicrobiales bacterium]
MRRFIKPRSRCWFRFHVVAAGVAAAVGIRADILVGPQFPFSEPVAAQRHERNWHPEIAYNSGRWLIAWAKAPILPDGPNEIRAALFDEDGGLATRFALPVAESYGSTRLEEVAAARLGNGYLVAWTLIDTQGENYSAAVQVARVDRNGNKVGGHVTVSAPNTLARFPQLASAGDRCLLAWTDDIQIDGTIELRGCMVPAEGPLTELTVRDLSPPGLAQDEAAVAFSGGNFLAVWTAGPAPYGIYGATIGLDGEPRAPFAIAASGNERDAKVARLGDGFLVTWFDFSRDFGAVGEFGEIRAARLSAAGQVLDTPPLVVRPNPNNDSVLFGEIAGDADATLILWTETDETDGSSGLHARRLLPDGTIETPQEYPITDAKQIFDAALEPGAQKWLVAHSHSADEPINGQWPSKILARQLTKDSAPLGDTAVVSETSNRTEAVSVATTGDGFVAVWQDDRDQATSGWDVYSQRFSADGIPLDAQPILIVGGEGDQISPAVAANDNTWAVVWTDRRPAATPAGPYFDYGIGSRVMGSLLPVMTILSSPDVNARAPAVAAGPGGFMVVWRQDDSQGVDDIFGTQLSALGTASTPNGFAVCTHPAKQSAPAVASNGQSYLVTWRDERPPNGGDHIYAKFFQQAVPPEIPDGFPVAPNAEQYAPEVAANVDEYLVVWRQSVPLASGSLNTIAAIRVSSTGSVVDPAPLQLVSPGIFIREPAVTAFANGWLVGWLDDEKVCAARVFKGPSLGSATPFEIAGPDFFDGDTLTMAGSPTDGVLFGVLREDVQRLIGIEQQRVMGILAFPNEQLPHPVPSLDVAGDFHLAWTPSPHFPLSADVVELSEDAHSWLPLSGSSSVAWSFDAQGRLVLDSSTKPRLFVRLRPVFGEAP